MHERELRIGARIAAASLAGLAASVAVGQELEPFRATNLNPPVAIVGLPVWAPVPDRTTFGLRLDIANHYRLSQSGSDSLLLDGETSRLRAWLEHPVGEHWSLAADLPILQQSGGVLDDLVDAWHSAFGMPDGGRNLRPEGVLEYRMADAVGQFFALDESGSAAGDLSLGVARRLGALWSMRLTLKLPTGDEDILAGSGATDFSVGVLRHRRSEVGGRPASYFFGGAWTAVGEPQRVRFAAESTVASALLGGAVALGERFGIKGQIDVNSPVYDSPLEEIGQTAVQATIGGWLHFGESISFDFAVSEDLHVSTTPDVVISLGFSTRRQ